METEKIEVLMTDQIDDPEFAMRTELDRNGLWELADNIKQNGLINPITVRPRNNRYEVVAGHRRFSACKIAGIIKIKCVVRELDDNAAFSVMAAENLERADVDVVDEAIFIQRFMEQTKLTIQEVSKKLRRSVQYVESRLQISDMPDYMQSYLKNNEIKLGVALALVEITEDRLRHMWVDMAVRDGISVAQADFWVQGWKLNTLPGSGQGDSPPEGFEAERQQPVMFECAIDGHKYDARLFKTMFIYEGNISVFNEIVSELRKTPAETISTPAN